MVSDHYQKGNIMSEIGTTALEMAAGQVLKKAAPRMKIEAHTHGGNEIVSIRGIVIDENELGGKQPANAPQIRGLAQAMRVLCENTHQAGDRCIDFQTSKNTDGTYTLICEADIPGRITKPLKEQLNINLESSMARATSAS
jgi:chemotaxis receptor (MCP) glutamine deamidase CheD